MKRIKGPETANKSQHLSPLKGFKDKEVIHVKEHIEYLQNLGLTEYQAKTMLVLFAKREVTAEGICKHSGIPLTKIYSVLRSLEDKTIIKCSPGKPRVYRCAEPADVINELIKKITSRIDWLKEAKREQLKKIKAIELPTIQKEKIHPMFGAEVAA